MKSKKSSLITACRCAASNSKASAGEKNSCFNSAKSFAACAIGLCLFCTVLFSLTSCKKKGTASFSGKGSGDISIRVLLLKDAKIISLKTNSVSNVAADNNLNSFTLKSSQSQVTFSGGSFNIGGKKITCGQLTISPRNPFNLNGKSYRGILQLIANPQGNSFDVINILPLETYLAGVIGSEMPSYWEAAALEAQAVCCRTYCLYIKRQFGSERSWDLTATQANQVYGGVSAETQSIRQAVNKTKGKVLVCRQEDGSMDLFPAYFSSSCGGHTEDSRSVFGGGEFEPLAGVACPYCKLVAKPLQFSWPDFVCEKSVLSDRLIAKYPTLISLSAIVGISPVKQTDFVIDDGRGPQTFSRITNFKLTGSTGQISYIKAEDLRLTIDPSGSNFKSTICEFEDANDKLLITNGRGYGHGCGLCQCGAEAMARFQNKSFSEILAYYYPNSRIETIN